MSNDIWKILDRGLDAGHHSPVLSRTPALSSIPQLGASGDNVVNSGCESSLGCDEETELADFLYCPHSSEQLRSLTLGTAGLRVSSSVNRLLPERSVDVAGRYINTRPS